MNAKKPLVSEIRSGSLDDGQGIRTVIFLKGCPLRCVWCQNPENIDIDIEIAFDQSSCTNCMECVHVCPNRARQYGNTIFYDRKRCKKCGECTKVCPSMALKSVGKYIEPEALVNLIMKDEIFWRNSKGGVTLSGGEPCMFPKYSSQVLRLLKEKGIHTVVETCGHFNLNIFMVDILPYVDQILFDLKLADDGLHRRFTGMTNRVILRNFKALVEVDREKVCPRIPLIPGITAVPDNLKRIALILNQVGVADVSFLPYNPMWKDKILAIGKEPIWYHQDFMPHEEVERWKEFFLDYISSTMG